MSFIISSSRYLIFFQLFVLSFSFQWTVKKLKYWFQLPSNYQSFLQPLLNDFFLLRRNSFPVSYLLQNLHFASKEVFPFSTQQNFFLIFLWLSLRYFDRKNCPKSLSFKWPFFMWYTMVNGFNLLTPKKYTNRIRPRPLYVDITCTPNILLKSKGHQQRKRSDNRLHFSSQINGWTREIWVQEREDLAKI